MGDLLSNWIVALLSAGGAAFVWAAAKGVELLRSGGRGRERDAWDDLYDHNAWLERRAQLAEQDRQYLMQQLAHARWQLTTNGLQPEPREIVLPSERPGTAVPSHRRRRSGRLRLPLAGRHDGTHEGTDEG